MQARAERNAALDAEIAKRSAEIKAEMEAKYNPNKLDRSQYSEITVEDFSFDMVAGRLAAGAKVTFKTQFLTRPTGTSYRFKNVDPLITLSTAHNFVRDTPDKLFDSSRSTDDRTVKIYVTVKKPGQSGECSVDILEWEEGRSIYIDGKWAGSVGTPSGRVQFLRNLSL
jgi:hypothetical protein